MVLKTPKEESKMAELTQEERTDVEVNLAWEKREKKIFLICTLVCCIIGIGTGIGLAVGYGDINIILGGIFGGMWLGTGIGGSVDYFRNLPHIVKEFVKEKGLGEGFKAVLIGLFGWVIIFTLLGVLGFLIRLLMKNHKIKKLGKLLSA
jgi:hypothetical protein